MAHTHRNPHSFARPRRTALRIGDIVTRRVLSGIGRHFGVCVGPGVILEIQKVSGPVAVVRTVSTANFAAGHVVRIERRPSNVVPSAVVARAQRLLQQRRFRYSAVGWSGFNCEHVARYVQTGDRPRSDQADVANFGIGALAAGLVLYLASDSGRR